MYYNGDFINLHFSGKPDTWNNKPPLLIWLISISYHIFGFNEFALRFPSAIASIIFFIVFFKLICLYKPNLFAFGCCLLLMACKAIIGHHAGRTGDFDALLLMFLTISVYFFLTYLDFNRSHHIFFSFMALGAAFYTKGTASFLLLPCFLLYAAIRQKICVVFCSKNFLLAGFIFIAVVFSWIVLVLLWGEKYDPSDNKVNALFTLFKTDTIDRITGVNNETASTVTYFFTVLDAKLNLWNYLLYGALFYFLFISIKNKSLMQAGDNLTQMALVFAGVITFQVLLMKNKHVWYLIPSFPFYAIIIVSFVEKVKRLKFIFVGLLLFTLTRQIIFIINEKSVLHTFFSSFNMQHKNSTLYIADQPSQNLYLYLLWNAEKKITKADTLLLRKGDIIVHDNTNKNYNGEPVLKYNQTVISVIE